MTTLPGEHGWSEEALFSKALVYIGKMNEHSAEDWEYGFWSSLGLESLCRSAIAHVSPALLAAQKDWKNIHYALGYEAVSKKFAPKSADMTQVLDMLNELVPQFSEFRRFCDEHIGRRNAELHSGDLEFKDLKTGRWLPKYFEICSVLLTFMGKELSDLFEDTESAEQLIEAAKDEAAKAVQGDIVAHKAIWHNKGLEERTALAEHSQDWASREKGHRVECPSCGNPGLLKGIAQGPVTTRVDDEAIIQKQTVVPMSFECVACGLKVSGLPKLVACGLGNNFTETTTSDAADFFGLYTEGQYQDALAEMPEIEYDYND